MKKEDLKIGMKVYCHDDKSSIYTITSINSNEDTVNVEHFTRNVKPVLHIEDIKVYDFNVENAILENIQSKIDEATSLFDQAFNKYREAINYADENNFYSFRNSEFIDLSALENVIISNGWSSSSLWCS